MPRMKSNKQRRKEIRDKRIERAQLSDAAQNRNISRVEANENELKHNHTVGPLPSFYIDKAFVCIDCKIKDIWTAKSQKWFYEIAKGSIFATASRCRACRKIRRDDKEEQRKHMKKMAELEPHPNESFFKNT